MSSASRDPNDAQWAAIRATDDHLLVSASAGTGKTFTVVQKILFLLGVPVRGEMHSTPLTLDDIAAITFTNHAAAELKNKLRDALREAGRRDDAYRVDGARVGTIHGFCTSILREFALRTGRSPSLQLVEEAESILRRGEAVRDSILSALEDSSIEGLSELLAEHTVEKIQERVTLLVAQGDHLRTLIGLAGNQPQRERVLLALAGLAQETMAQRLDDAAQVDFDRMITWTRDLIRDDPDVRRTLQQRIRVLFIDEFQDVDPTQREIAYLLAEPESGRKDTTRLVLVGDAKQSIYRFRNADVTVWSEVENDFATKGWGRVTPLVVNRRSVAPILAFVDHTVGRMLDTPIDPALGMQPFEIRHAPMTAHRKEVPAIGGVEILTIPESADGKARAVEQVRAIEARALAERVCELHEVSGVAWRDVAVLLCGWGAANVYEQALRERGVPTYILRDEGFYSLLEVTDVVVALDAIRNPWDDRVLFGFLRSPFVGLADESLLWIARKCSSPYWTDLATVTLDDSEEHQRLQRGFELLTQLGTLRDRVSTAELIETLLSESGYLAHLALLGQQGQQRLANLRKLVRIARLMSDGSVGDFLDMVKQQRETKTREGEERLFGANEDVVTITSVHSAKGLEWGVVFWCDLVRGAPQMPYDLLIGRHAISMQEPDGTKSPQFDALHAALKQERDAETKRLWYVAATRAKDLLVVSGIPLGKTKGDCPAAELTKLLPGLESGAVAYQGADGVSYAARVRTATVDEDVEDEEAVERVPESIGDIAAVWGPRVPVAPAFGRGRHSATELLSADRCARRHWLRYVVGLKEPSLRATKSDGQTNAIRRGLIVHDVLEHYQEEVELGVLLEAAIGRWDPDAPPPEAQPGVTYRRKLAAGVETILGSPEYRAVFDRPGAERELAFSYVRGVGETIEGSIDLVAPIDGGYAIVDVKTSECDADVAVIKAEQYGPQRAVYSAAVEAISGASVESFGFQFAGAGAHVGEVRTDAVRVRDGATIADLIQITRSNDRALTRFPAECGYCGYKAAGWCPGASAAPAAV